MGFKQEPDLKLELNFEEKCISEKDVKNLSGTVNTMIEVLHDNRGVDIVNTD